MLSLSTRAPALASRHSGRRLVRSRACAAQPSTDTTANVDPTSLTLTAYDARAHTQLDLIVVGAGPSGLAVACEASKRGLRVCVVDPSPLQAWPNNYGVWSDEFEEMGLGDCLDREWTSAIIHIDDESVQTRRVLDRRYARVDRRKLKHRLLSGCVESGCVFHLHSCTGIEHDDWSSVVSCDDGTSVCGATALDATGHARRLVTYEKDAFDPGYQAAYGQTIDVRGTHPFPLDEMSFMDWRDEHLKGAGDEEMRRRNEELPTFLYTMPLSETRIFVEETSLVARPQVPFDELKARLAKRLEWLGVEVDSVVDEEYCLIPMGGVLPTMPQRVLGLGGTAGMVHPATGFMLSRALGAAPLLVDALVAELSKARRLSAEALPVGASKEAVLRDVRMQEVSASVWSKVWPKWRLRQREFFNTGMDILLRLGLDATRSFFGAFFSCSKKSWQGFLSYRLTLPELVGFGYELFRVGDNRMRLYTLASAIPGVVTLAQKIALGGYSSRVGTTELRGRYGQEATKMRMPDE